REVALGAFANADMPFEKLVEELQPERAMSHTPLFQVMFALQNTPEVEWALSGLRLRPEPVELLDAKFDFSMTVVEAAGGLSGYLGYRAGMFDATMIARIAGHWNQWLRELAGQPQRAVMELDMLTVEERRQILEDWNQTAQDFFGHGATHLLFEAQAARTPDAIAIAFKDARLTYRELDLRTSRLARLLRRRRVGPEVLVGICLERSLEMVIAVFGVLKAGGAYVPMEPEHPQKRLQHTVRFSE